MSASTEESDIGESVGPTAGQSRRSVWFLASACLITLAVLVMLGWGTWDSQRRLTAVAHRALRIQKLQGRIAHLDEVLTMSARMAAASGEPQWEQRYRRFEPQLNAVITEAQRLVPDLDSTAETDAANQRLVQLEKQAFELVRQGRARQALEILSGTEYAAQKTRYAEGMASFDRRLDATAQSALRIQERNAIARAVVAAITIPVLVIGWILVLRMLRASRRELTRELARRQELARAVADSTQEVASAAAQIAASAQQQERSVRSFREATGQATGSVHDIAQTVGNLTQTMKEVNDLAHDTAGRATTGQQELQQLDQAMRRMAEATAAMGAKIDVIKETAGNIDLATNAMVKVVDQTNVLSINAAIEAEKAGQHAEGFRVVSTEIRRLADQTAEATLDIDAVVKGIHESVAGGIREVTEFEKQMQESVAQARQLAEQLGGIVADVAGLSTRFAEISQAMTSQSVGTDQITHSIEQLDSGAEQIAASSVEFARVTTQLHGVVQKLTTKVAAFEGP